MVHLYPCSYAWTNFCLYTQKLLYVQQEMYHVYRGVQKVKQCKTASGS
jgi:hypothetical protein